MCVVIYIYIYFSLFLILVEWRFLFCLVWFRSTIFHCFYLKRYWRFRFHLSEMLSLYSFSFLAIPGSGWVLVLNIRNAGDVFPHPFSVNYMHLRFFFMYVLYVVEEAFLSFRCIDVTFAIICISLNILSYLYLSHSFLVLMNFLHSFVLLLILYSSVSSFCWWLTLLQVIIQVGSIG